LRCRCFSSLFSNRISEEVGDRLSSFTAVRPSQAPRPVPYDRPFFVLPSPLPFTLAGGKISFVAADSAVLLPIVWRTVQSPCFCAFFWVFHHNNLLIVPNFSFLPNSRAPEAKSPSRKSKRNGQEFRSVFFSFPFRWIDPLLRKSVACTPLIIRAPINCVRSVLVCFFCVPHHEPGRASLLAPRLRSCQLFFGCFCRLLGEWVLVLCFPPLSSSLPLCAVFLILFL